MRFCIVLFYSPIRIKNSDANSKILMSEFHLLMSGTEPFKKVSSQQNHFDVKKAAVRSLCLRTAVFYVYFCYA